MEEMVEPDRTIMIVSIIGLVIIWGSFFYHKYVQDGGKSGREELEEGVSMEAAGNTAGESARENAKEEAPAAEKDQTAAPSRRKKGKKGKKR